MIASQLPECLSKKVRDLQFSEVLGSVCQPLKYFHMSPKVVCFWLWMIKGGGIDLSLAITIYHTFFSCVFLVKLVQLNGKIYFDEY